MKRLASCFHGTAVAIFLALGLSTVAKGQVMITNSSPLPTATATVFYTVQLNATGGAGGPYSFVIVQGNLPPGLNIDSNTGVISGTPTATGNFNFIVVATDKPTNMMGTKQFLLPVMAPATLSIGPSTLPNATAGTQYGATLFAIGGTSPYHGWIVIIGSLLPDFALDPNTGVISGTPMQMGSRSFTVQVTDAANNTATMKYVLTINSGNPSMFTITTLSPLKTAEIGQPVFQPITATMGTRPYLFMLATPQDMTPPGLTLNQDGTLTGMATQVGTFSFVVTVTDSADPPLTTSKSFTISVVLPPTITNSKPFPPGILGVLYSQFIMAVNGVTPYQFFPDPFPVPGLNLNSATGEVSGTPTQLGTYQVRFALQDSVQGVATQDTTLTIGTAGAAPLRVSVSALQFAAFAGGPAPPCQSFTILSASGMPVNYMVLADSGPGNSAVPKWVIFRPPHGATPGNVVVCADQAGMPVGVSSGRLLVLDMDDKSQPAIFATLTLTISAKGQQLDVAPAYLSETAGSQAVSIPDQAVFVSNSGGGGPISFRISILGRDPGLVTVTPSGPQTNAILIVHFNLTGRVGRRSCVLRVQSSAGDKDVAISLFVPDKGATAPAAAASDAQAAPVSDGGILRLSGNGVRFRLKQGNTTQNAQTVKALNLGDPAAIINLTAGIVQGRSDLVTLVASATATTSNPGTITITPSANTARLAVGSYYALGRVSDSSVPNSDQFLNIVIEVVDTQAAAVPEFSTGGLLFVGVAGGTPPPAQKLSVFTSNTDLVALQVSAASDDGSNWLNATPASARVSSLSSAQISVTVNQNQGSGGVAGVVGLVAGTYFGQVAAAIGDAVTSLRITFVVLPAPPVSSPPVGALQAQAPAPGCTPKGLALTPTGLADNFAVPAGWPATLVVQLNDDCGSPVSNGSVVASFSNGDPPLSLNGDLQTGTYSATWQPGFVTPTMAVTVRAAAGSLQTATAQLIGTVKQNNAAPPALVPNGALHISFDASTNALLGAGLAPGNVTQVYGTGLASSATSTGRVPCGLPSGLECLPTDFNGTFMLVGGLKAPLFYVANFAPPINFGLNVQIPSELAPNRQYQIIVSANGALTLPETIDVVPLQPGVATYPDPGTGTSIVIAQLFPDNSLISSTKPAKPGDILTFYLAGMGPTNPSVKSGNPTPLQPVLATVQPTVTLDGQALAPADILYAGLTPTGFGLYQISMKVPSRTFSASSVDLVVTQGGVNANATKLPVVH